MLKAFLWCVAQPTSLRPQLPRACIQSPSQSRKVLEDMVVLFFVESWWSLVQTNFRSALPPSVVMEVSRFLPLHVSPVDSCHCGYRQLSDIAVACTCRAPPYSWMKYLPEMLAIKTGFLALDLVLWFCSWRFCDFVVKAVWSDLIAGFALSRRLE